MKQSIEAKRKTGELLRQDQLFDDILNDLVAGMEATSYVLSFGTYFLLNNPDVKAKLEAELREVSPFIREEFNHRKIMTLPYLVRFLARIHFFQSQSDFFQTAVTKECLQLSNPVPGFLPRVVPKSGVNIGGHHIPGGVRNIRSVNGGRNPNMRSNRLRYR